MSDAISRLNAALEGRYRIEDELAHATEEHESGLLAVVPIADARGKLHGVLAIREMHFMAFQQANHNVLSLLGGYVGDLLARSGGLGNSRAGRFLAGGGGASVKLSCSLFHQSRQALWSAGGATPASA